MPEIVLDAEYFHHRKVLAAGPDARDLHIGCILYSARMMTDGFVHESALVAVDPRTTEPETARKLAMRLVEVGLLDAVDGGYVVHDYLTYQLSAAQVALREREARDRRQKAAERQRRFRRARHSGADPPVENPVTRYVTRDVTRDSGSVSTRARAGARGPDDDLREPEKPLSPRSSSSDHAHIRQSISSLKPTRSQRSRWLQAAHSEPARFAACLSVAVERADRPAAYLDELVRSGQWPHPVNGNGTTSRPTGWREVRGTHALSYVRDPAGTDQPPASYLATVKGDA